MNKRIAIFVSALLLTLAPVFSSVAPAQAADTYDRVCVDIRSTSSDSSPITAYIDDAFSGATFTTQVSKGYCSDWYKKGQITGFYLQYRIVCTSQWGGVYTWQHASTWLTGYYAWNSGTMNGPLDLTCRTSSSW